MKRGEMAVLRVCETIWRAVTGPKMKAVSWKGVEIWTWKWVGPREWSSVPMWERDTLALVFDVLLSLV